MSSLKKKKIPLKATAPDKILHFLERLMKGNFFK